MTNDSRNFVHCLFTWAYRRTFWGAAIRFPWYGLPISGFPCGDQIGGAQQVNRPQFGADQQVYQGVNHGKPSIPGPQPGLHSRPATLSDRARAMFFLHLTWDQIHMDACETNSFLGKIIISKGRSRIYSWACSTANCERLPEWFFPEWLSIIINPVFGSSHKAFVRWSSKYESKP